MKKNSRRSARGFVYGRLGCRLCESVSPVRKNLKNNADAKKDESGKHWCKGVYHVPMPVVKRGMSPAAARIPSGSSSRAAEGVTIVTVDIESLPRVHDVLGADAARTWPYRLPHGLTAHVVADPGTAFSPATQEKIYAALLPVSVAAFAADLTGYWAQRRSERYFERLAEFILIADADDRMIGWTGHSVIVGDGYANVYLEASGMVATEQSRGVTRTLFDNRSRTSFVKHKGRERVYVSARTENPIVYKLMRRLIGADLLYPNPAGPTPPDVLACGHDLAAWLGHPEQLVPGTLVMRNAFAAVASLYGEVPVTGEPELDALFGGRLGPLDAYLVIGRVSESLIVEPDF